VWLIIEIVQWFCLGDQIFQTLEPEFLAKTKGYL